MTPVAVLAVVGFLFTFSLSLLFAQEISPAQEEEFNGARQALEAAQKANAEMYAPENMRQARDLLSAAENARGSKDGLKLAHVSRLARAHAELAKIIADLRGEEERLATANEDLQKAKAEIQRLKQSQ